MPWTAIDANGRHLTAPDLSWQEWRELQRTYPNLGLTMTCCDAQAIPRVSSRGTPYFAHAPNAADCGWDRQPAVMSPEHREHQLAIRRTLRALGWEAEIEVPGQTPDGERWRADVLATRNGTRAAIEIQLSDQTAAETIRRTRAYAASGVACLWLFARLPDALDRIPASRMRNRRQPVAYPVVFPPSNPPNIRTRVIEAFLVSATRLHESEEEARLEIERERLEVQPLFEAKLAEIAEQCSACGLMLDDEFEDDGVPALSRIEDADGWGWQATLVVCDRGGHELTFTLRRHHDVASWKLGLDGSLFPHHFGDGELVPTHIIPNVFGGHLRGDL